MHSHEIAFQFDPDNHENETYFSIKKFIDYKKVHTNGDGSLWYQASVKEIKKHKFEATIQFKVEIMESPEKFDQFAYLCEIEHSYLLLRKATECMRKDEDSGKFKNMMKIIAQSGDR